MITSIIFSKDRPLQLDLCLKSLNKNFPDSENIVIYKNSEAFEEAHQKLMSEHSDTEFWPQGHSIFKDIYLAIANSTGEYICFFTDDNIVYKPLPPIRKDALDNTEAVCFSLRMGGNINKRSYNGQICDDLPPTDIFQLDENTIFWNKTRNSYGSYWSYCLSVDGHIFRKTDVQNMFDEMSFLDERFGWTQTPNGVESAMQRFWCGTPPVIFSFVESVVVNSPNNRVQDSHLMNKSGEFYNCDPEMLLKEYMEGKRINLDLLDFSDIKCPHTEIDIMKGLV